LRPAREERISADYHTADMQTIKIRKRFLELAIAMNVDDIKFNAQAVGSRPKVF
jgi:hypothetical protein